MKPTSRDKYIVVKVMREANANQSRSQPVIYTVLWRK